MNNVVNNVPYLRSSREYPEEPQELTQEISKSYIDIANAVNSRMIGIFPLTRPSITGETWYINPNLVQQTLRQVYTFSFEIFSSPLEILHNINTDNIDTFTRIYGVVYDDTNWYPLPYVDVVDATNQINVIVNSTNIVITGGGGGDQPAITSGLVVLEWLTNG